MYDDGTHGDERAGDGVWSLAATFAPGTKLYYVYTNSGLEGRWQGLDVPAIRSFTVGTTPKLYRPIESFGQLYMHADNWHTNAAGYQLIARALFEVLKQAPRLETGTSVLPSHREN
jgi:lysophospholipase L1-like esterase